MFGMRKKASGRAVVFLVAVGVGIPGAGLGESLPNTQFVPGELLISLTREAASRVPSGTTLAQGRFGIPEVDQLGSRMELQRLERVFRRLDVAARSVDDGEFLRVFKLTFAPRVDIFTALRDYKANPVVEYAELNLIYAITLVPSDSAFDEQWALRNRGTRGGVRNADIRAPQAWDLETGRPNVQIAIIDTGVDHRHPDLRGGRVLTGLGYDFVNDRKKATDDHGHGTYVAGIAAANSDNGRGVAGVCWGCQIVPVKVMNADGKGTAEQVAQGIKFAADRGVQIISMSLGFAAGCGCSQTVARAINYAWDRGVLLIAASGNDGEKEVTSYPGASSRVLSVGASDRRDREAEFSNRDPRVDLLAPGVDIIGLKSRDGEVGYFEASGTSAATPHVAGVAGLVLSTNPSLDNAQLWKTLRIRSDRIGRNLPHRLNAFKAVKKQVAGRVNRRPDGCEEEPDDCPFGCPGEIALAPTADPKEWVELLERLRDEVLAASEAGRELSDLYSKHSYEVARIFLLDASFRSEVRNTLGFWEPFLRSALGDGNAGVVTPQQAASARKALSGLEDRASYELRSDLDRVEIWLAHLGLLSPGTSQLQVLRRLELN